MESYTVKYSFQNTTSRFIVLGNYHHVLGHYETHDQAVKAINNLDIIELGFGTSCIASPGEMVSGELTGSILLESVEDEWINDFFGKGDLNG